MSLNLPPKAERLKTLAEFSDRVPVTLSLVSALQALASNTLPKKKWYLRSTSSKSRNRYQLDDRLITTAELRARAQTLPDPSQYVLQEYLHPAVSGVTYISDNILITECVFGASEKILRHGANGYRICRSARGKLMWTNFSAFDTFQADDAFVSFVLGRLTNKRHSKFLRGGIVEWIINPEGTLYLVDYKQPGPNFISNIHESAPEEFFIYKQPDLALVLPNTSIEYLDALEQSPQGLKFKSGSPLSHVCLEAFYKKIPTSVANARIS